MASHRSRRNQSRSGAATNSDLDGRRVGQAETDDCRDGVAAHRSTRRWLVHAPPAERGWPDWNGGLPPPGARGRTRSGEGACRRTAPGGRERPGRVEAWNRRLPADGDDGRRAQHDGRRLSRRRRASGRAATVPPARSRLRCAAKLATSTAGRTRRATPTPSTSTATPKFCTAHAARSNSFSRTDDVS